MSRPRRTLAAARLVVAAAVATCVAAPAADAVAASAPAATAFFSQPTTTPGAAVGLGLTIRNTDGATALTGVGVSLALPPGLVVATPGDLFSSCDGSANAPDGGSTISLTGATLQVAGDEGDSCLVVVDVVAAGPGVFDVASGAPTSTQIGPGSPSAPARLTVLATPPPPPPVDPPALTQSFATSPIKVSETTTVSFTIANPNAHDALANIEFDDALPAGLRVASPAGIAGTCVSSGTVLANDGDGRIALLGLQLPAAASCGFSVGVTATAATSGPNATGPVSFSYDAGGGELVAASGPGASATLMAIGPPVLSAAFAPAASATGAKPRLAFAVANPNATIALSGVGFTAALSAGIVVATPANVAGSCGSGTIGAAAGSGSVTLASGTLPAGGGCTFAVDVVALSAGLQTVTTSALSSIEGGSGAATSASLLVSVPVAPPPPPGPPPPPPVPSNRFKVTNSRAARDGTVRFDVAVAGRGRVTIRETLPASSERVRKPGTAAFTIARKTVRAAKAGKLHVKVLPNARGERAIRRARRSLRLTLRVSFRPTGGRAGGAVRKTLIVHRR